MTLVQIGDYLLDVCNATNIRIVKGRLFHDKGVGKLTCFAYYWESSVDYLLTSVKNFHDLTDFNVHNFTEF